MHPDPDPQVDEPVDLPAAATGDDAPADAAPVEAPEPPPANDGAPEE